MNNDKKNNKLEKEAFIRLIGSNNRRNLLILHICALITIGSTKYTFVAFLTLLLIIIGWILFLDIKKDIKLYED